MASTWNSICKKDFQFFEEIAKTRGRRRQGEAAAGFIRFPVTWASRKNRGTQDMAVVGTKTH